MSKISVIIPVYNTEKYLRECLDSIINQTLKDIEIICVNDGSTDKSLDILNEYALKDKRIKVIDKENSGAGDCRNIGFKKSNSEYIIFFDSDDYMTDECLENLYKTAIKNNSDVTLCKSFTFYEKTKDYKDTTWELKQDLLDNKVCFSPKEISKYIFQFCVAWPWDKLYKRELITNNNLEFQNLRHSNDTYFVLMSLVYSNLISYTDYHGIYHREHNNSLAKTRTKAPDSFYYALIALFQELKNKNLYKTYEQSFVNYCINFSIWHIITINNKKAKLLMIKKLYQLLHNHININKYNKSYFYDKNEYMFALELLGKNKIKKIIKQFFSVRNNNDRTHKIITILGIKIKIKIN